MFPICIGQSLMDVPSAAGQQDDEHCGIIVTCAAAVPASNGLLGSPRGTVPVQGNAQSAPWSSPSAWG